MVILAIGEGKLNIYLPYGDGVMSRIFGNIPWILPRILPLSSKGHSRTQAVSRQDRGTQVRRGRMARVTCGRGK